MAGCIKWIAAHRSSSPMSVDSTARNGVEPVIVLQSGRDAVRAFPPGGTTIPDLLRSLGLHPDEPIPLIDGRSRAEFFSPPPGSVIPILPSRANDSGRASTLSIGRFADEPLFDQMITDIAAARDAERA